MKKNQRFKGDFEDIFYYADEIHRMPRWRKIKRLKNQKLIREYPDFGRRLVNCNHRSRKYRRRLKRGYYDYLMYEEYV